MTTHIGREATFVLVHAAWADASSWSKVILLLKSHGHAALAVQIPLTSVADDVTAAEHALERISGPIVLVGHSYGGAVITGLRAGADRISALVYVAGMAPEIGETVGSLFHRDPPHPQRPPISPDAHGMLWMANAGFHEAVAPDATAEEALLMASTQRPISMLCLAEPLAYAGWHATPSWFLIAENDRMISLNTQRFMAERMRARVVAKPVDHTPLISAPEVVVETLLEAAQHRV